MSEQPLLQVSAGRPSDEELVAVLVALQTLDGGPVEPAAPPEPSRWTDRARAIGAAPRPGPGAWVASARL